MKSLKIIISAFLVVVMVLSLNTATVSAKTTTKFKTSAYKSKDGLWKYGIDKETNTHSIIEYYGKENTIELPKSIDGYKINALFSLRNDDIININIPKNYTIFTFDCFREMQNLKTVTFSREYDGKNKITKFDARLFYMCPKLEKVIFPNQIGYNKTYYSMNLKRDISGGEIGGSMFEGCESLKEVVFPEDVVELGNAVFKGCTSIESIVIPNGVISIGTSSFKNTNSLKTLVLPESLENNYGLGYISNNTNILCPKDSYIDKEIKVLKEEDPDLYNFSVVNISCTDTEGDINNDNVFSIKDTTLLQKYLVKMVDIKDVNCYMLDYNKDCKININDCTSMQYELAHISSDDE